MPNERNLVKTVRLKTFSIATVSDTGWFTLLRLCGPLEHFFDKTWRPGEIELGK
jgi:hypothetical protein